MAWTDQVDDYCERIDPSFWAEPVNALSNAAFLIAAWAVWRMARHQDDWAPKLLALLLAAIGLGSFTFHTFATNWAMLADVGPITLFIVAYVYMTTTRILGLPVWAGLASVIAFFPYSATAAGLVTRITGPLNGSQDYVPVALLIFAFAALAWRRAPATARDLAIGGLIFVLSLIFRTIDLPLCGSLPLGTHFLWHGVNGLLLWWMARTLIQHQRRQSLAMGAARG